MKANKPYFLTLLLVLLCCPLMEAQYGYGSRYGNRQRTGIPQATTPPKAPEPLTAEEIVAEQMPRIIEALELGEFEQAVVSSILTKYVQQSIELQLLQLDKDKTREAQEKIRANQMEELKQGLPPDKFEALVALQKEGYNKVKREKKKKKKKSKG